MNGRIQLRIFIAFAVLLLQPPTFAHNEIEYFRLDREPSVRIGLLRNVSSVSITTNDSSLIEDLGNESYRMLNTSAVTVSSRLYNPPVYEFYTVEISKLESRTAADELAGRIRSELSAPTTVMPGKTEGIWRIRVGEDFEVRADADKIVNSLTEQGFEGAAVIVGQFSAPSDDAIELTAQISSDTKSKVRSLKIDEPAKIETKRGPVQLTTTSRPTARKNRNAIIFSGIREIVVSGSGPDARFSSLRAVKIGSVNNNGIIKLNGKRYRGKMEIFVNSSGRITVVNVVPMEDYLLGVVPSELSLPQIEAQKAQAVAARTYAVANKDGYGLEGFDMLPTVWSQVYKGVAIETSMGTRAVKETQGVVATYRGKPINALYTSTCGGRTEDSGNIFEFNEPYLRGVNCALDGRDHFDPFLIKTLREPALIRNEANYQYVRLASKLAVNNFLMITGRFDDDYFDDPPIQTELKSWFNQVSGKFGKAPPLVENNSSKPLKLARILHGIIYPADSEESADTLLSESDINYQLSFLDAAEVPKQDRAMLAELMRDGWFSIYSDLTIKPNKNYSRGKILRLIDGIYAKKNWNLAFENGTTKPTEDGKLILQSGRSENEMKVNPNLFLFRKFGDEYYQVKEAAIVGGEKVRYKLNPQGEVIYLEIDPIDKTTVAERMSPFTLWRTSMSASTARARLGRYVKGMGTLIDVKVKNKGFSRRATELEITTTNGTHSLKGGKIRSAFRLKEQLFVMDKRYGSNGRVARFNFTGRGWGHGVGMCQYGAYGFAQMGLRYEQILKHYYTGIDVVKAY